MDSREIFLEAIHYEKKVRDLYFSAVEKVDDKRGKTLFQALGADEQSHIDFLEYSLDILQSEGVIDVSKLNTPIPAREKIEKQMQAMSAEIPEKMLGDVKRLLDAALKLEIETSNYYKKASEKAEGRIKEVLEKFLEIENRHIDIVQIELDHAQKSGHWFNFMEISMEVE
ncbi:rubrerythrin [Desulfomarina sp.]